ncbi:hypothetical protein [Tenacibaculum haliotis]|uniref:hypothetical protein n=1 Tax=Tenacibaculum haliotis TaxID=1888914 RepID=UPI0021AEF802|nr:hypothetical protein [Tenacibaculum haliotis]MCT4697566.1 hypothetical protein [Tenacibaculum haliotis]
MKNRKINFIKLRIFFFGISLLFTNCENETNFIQNNTSIPTISESKNFLLNNNNSFKAKNSSNFTDRIDWNNSKEQYYKENTELLYSPIQLNATKAKSFVASIKVDGIIDNRIITLLYDNDNSPKIFSGTIFIHNKKGRLTEFYNYKNGIKEEKYIVKETSNTAQARSSSDYDCYDIEYLQWFLENSDEPMVMLAPCVALNASIETGDSGSNGNSWYEPIDFLNDDFYNGNDNINDNDLNGGGGNNWYTPNCGEGYILDENNNCVPNPCRYINLQIQNPRYTDQADQLKRKTGLKKETGYKQNKDGSQVPLNETNNGHSLEIPIDRNTVGYMHTHLNDFLNGKIDKITGNPIIEKPIKIFSPADLLKFLQIVKNSKYNGVPTHLVYGTVIASTGNYTLRFTGNIDDIVGLSSANSYLADYELYFKEKFKGNKEKAFLHFLKDKIGINGINLYRIRDNGDIEKKTLKDNGNVDTNDCE